MKKSINIILIVFVLGLWGAIIYRYFNNFLFPEKTTLNLNSNNYSLIEINEKDTFNLVHLKRDPFLGKIYAANYASKNNFKIKKIEKKQKKTEYLPLKEISQIQYFGIIKSSNKKDEMIIVKIDNVIQKLRINSEFNGIKVKKTYKDSILISINNKIKCIKR
jgi:hypothetical protein